MHMADQSKPGDGVKIETIQMKKSINLFHCVAIMVAVTGHVSIFVSPTLILTNAGSIGLTLIMWVIGGFINLCLALCFTELGTMFPFAGGPYMYVLRVFGPLPAFMMLWGYYLLIHGPFWALVSYGASVYILQPFFPTCKPPEIGIKILAGWILVTFVALNCVYMKYVTKIQTVLSSTKIIGLLMIIVGGLMRLCQGEVDNFNDIMSGTKTDIGSLSYAVFFCTFSYGGWQVISSLLEEVKNPAKDVPRAVFITFLIVGIIYILTNIALFTVLRPAQLLQSNAVAVLFMQNLYGPLTPVITLLVGLCCIGVLNASIMGHSRVLFAGARNGHFPSIFGTLQIKFLTPWASILAITLLALLLLFTGGLVLFIEYIQVFSLIMTLFVLTSLLYLRRFHPEIPRPYKVNMILPVTQLIINFFMLVICLITEPTRTGLALVLFLTAIPVYWVGVSWKSKPKFVTSLIYKLTITFQKTFLLGKSE